jgi:hypothetical protein
MRFTRAIDFTSAVNILIVYYRTVFNQCLHETPRKHVLVTTHCIIRCTTPALKVAPRRPGDAASRLRLGANGRRLQLFPRVIRQSPDIPCRLPIRKSVQP